MTCVQCEVVIKKRLQSIKGLTVIGISNTSGKLTLEHPHLKKIEAQIINKIEKSGYELTHSSPNKRVQTIGILSIALVALLFIPDSLMNYLPKITDKTPLSFLFIAGVLTSLHCVTMCGGIALMSSGNDQNRAFKNSVHYNTGRVLSYTLLGGLVGSIGSVFSLSNSARSVFLIIVGSFMMYMGLQMAGILNLPLWLRNKIFKMNHFRAKFKSNSAFVIGLLNGFMPCGPLQTMQLYALGTMSFTKGAIAMFLFAVGTVPLMLGIGSLRRFISQNHQHKIMRFSGIVIVLFAFMIINRGFLWTGYSIESELSNKLTDQPTQEISTEKNYAPIVKGVQIVNMDVNGYYDLENVVVKKDIPVKININARRLSPCIDTITIPQHDVVLGLSPGENELTFTPDKEGDLVITCWMAMVTTYLEVE